MHGIRRALLDKDGRRRATAVLAGALSVALLAAPAARGENSLMLNIEKCNGGESVSADSQLAGCTAVIESGTATKLVLGIAYNNRGNAYTTKGDFDHAIADYALALESNPSYGLPLNNRGAVFLKQGDYEHAIENFDAALGIDANYASAFANRAEAHLRKGDYALAARDYDSAVRLRPSAKEIWNGRCRLRAITGELDAALADCGESLRLAPNADAFNSRAFIRLKRRQWDLAIADYSSALKLDPKQAASYYGRGQAKLRAGDRAGGRADIEAARALKPRIADEFSRYGTW
jgi:tetratricopeptide (TPR) repeat protein